MKTKKYTNLAIAITLSAAAPFAFSQEMENEGMADSSEEMAEEVAPAIDKGTLTGVIQDSVTFSILTKALKATGLDQTLGGKDNFTIFAPTDDAFRKLDPKTLDALMLPENKEKLRSLLLYHVVAGKVMSTDLSDMEVKTMNGESIEVDVDADEIEINEVKVASANVPATNGVMHSIGEVLVPESLDDFVGLED